MKFVVYTIVSVLVWVLFCAMGKFFHIEQQGFSAIMFYGFVAGGCSSTIGLLFASVMK